MLVAPILHAASGIWTNTTSGGNWGAAANWSNSIVADSFGFTADFNSVNIATDPTVVHLDSARTIGNLIFGDTNTTSAAGWLLDNNGSSANVLTLAGGTPTIGGGEATQRCLYPIHLHARMMAPGVGHPRGNPAKSGMDTTPMRLVSTDRQSADGMTSALGEGPPAGLPAPPRAFRSAPRKLCETSLSPLACCY